MEPRQIGWSQEAILLHGVSKQLERLAGILASSGGGSITPTLQQVLEAGNIANYTLGLEITNGAGSSTGMFPGFFNVTETGFGTQQTSVLGLIWNNAASTLINILDMSARTALGEASFAIPNKPAGTYILATTADIVGSGGYTVVSPATGATLAQTSGEIVVKCDATAGAFTLNLPTAVGNTAKFHIKKIAGVNTVTIDANGTQTIDGGLTAVLNVISASITIVSDNANWLII